MNAKRVVPSAGLMRQSAEELSPGRRDLTIIGGFCHRQNGEDWNAAAPGTSARSLLLSATLVALVLPLAGNHLAKHHDAVAVHEGDAREALAVLEGVANERLLRLEGALRHLVGLQRVWVLHFLTACLL